jgi:hypothetical protein
MGVGGCVLSQLLSTRLLCQAAIVPFPFHIGVPGKARFARVFVYTAKHTTEK